MVVAMRSKVRSYTEMLRIPEYKERFLYLQLSGMVGAQTFGNERYLNQILYNSAKWKKCRNEVVIRDDGCDLACPDYPIKGRVIVHHINPITIDDILEERGIVFDLDNLISVAHSTHEAIHYGDEHLLPHNPTIRVKNDTCPWKH